MRASDSAMMGWLRGAEGSDDTWSATRYRPAGGRSSNTRGMRREGLGRRSVRVQRCQGFLSGLGQASMVRFVCCERTARFAVASAHAVALAGQQARAGLWRAA